MTPKQVLLGLIAIEAGAISYTKASTTKGGSQPPAPRPDVAPTADIR